jgi:integrase
VQFTRKLTAKAVEKTKPGRHADGDGLYLIVEPSGAKRWLLYVYVKGQRRRREMGLGTWPKITLQQARDEARLHRIDAQHGIDPIEARKRAAASAVAEQTTFSGYADGFIASKRAGWKNEKHKAQWTMTLGATYCGSIRDKSINAISLDDVRALLAPIWTSKPETARRIRQRIEAVFDAAIAAGLYTGNNPANRRHVQHLLPRQRKLSRHRPSVPYKAMPAFMSSLQTIDGVGAMALRLAILTAARTNEIVSARWSDIDLSTATWTIPAERMKGARLHRVPLSPSALAVVVAVKSMANGGEFIFSLDGEKPISTAAMAAVLKRLAAKGQLPSDVDGRPAVVHGFRSSFRDWAAESEYPDPAAEAALAHAEKNGTVAAYKRTDYFEQRRTMMIEWASFLGDASAPSRKHVPSKSTSAHSAEKRLALSDAVH